MKTILTSMAIVLGAVASAQAQSHYRGPGYDHGYYHSHSSTIAEGYFRGVADLLRSVGESNLLNAEAAIKNEEARVSAMETQKYRANTYYDLRQIGRERRAAERRPRLSREDLARIARMGRPDRLSVVELDALTGELSWPVVLRGEDFGGHRAVLQSLFAQRASSGSMATEAYLKLQRTTADMKADLKAHIRELPPGDYVAARRFLESLAYDAQQPTRFQGAVAQLP